MDTARFADDLRLIPESLDRLADALDAGLPGLDALPETRRVLVLGMGSSRYAADVVARDARLRGRQVTVERASVRDLPAPADDLLVVAVSATGGSAEVLAAAERYRGSGRLVAVTNAPESALASASDVVVPLLAGREVSGVACRTFRSSLLVLDEVFARLDGVRSSAAATARAGAAASAALLDGAAGWLPAVSDILLGPDGTWVLAPAERLSSAEQAALMMREVPRRSAAACETGDWAHVDVYLTRTLDYRALVFAGSAWDGQALEWMRSRGSRWVAVGGELDGAEATVSFPGDDDPAVARLAEVLVGELVAERWRAADPGFAWSGR